MWRWLFRRRTFGVVVLSQSEPTIWPYYGTASAEWHGPHDGKNLWSRYRTTNYKSESDVECATRELEGRRERLLEHERACAALRRDIEALELLLPAQKGGA